MKRRRLYAAYEERQASQTTSPHKKSVKKRGDQAAGTKGETLSDGVVSGEQDNDPTPRAKSKYEPSQVYKSRKGDRFSSIGSGSDKES